VQRINFRPELGDSQAGDKVGDRKNDYAKHYYAGNYAPNYAAKTGFLVRKEMVRSEVRSKMMVNSLLVTSEVNSKKALFINDRL